MADKSIAKTFKGILRVANVQEATNQDEDYYFNPIYYGTPDKGTANETTGYDSAYAGLSSLLVRYTYPDDPYRNGKVPITDSLGNFMNVWVGEDSVTFGSDEENNGNNADTVKFTQLLYEKQFSQKRVFPVVEAEKAIIGLKERVLPEHKDSINSGTITVDESPYFDTVDAKIIVNNNYNHTASNIENNTTFKALSTVSGNTKTYRTVYQNTNPTLKDYDALVHYQDNIDKHNLDTNKVIDSIVDVVNLKDYVKEKLNLYLGNNVVEVPTGMIIWQYVDLSRWFCLSQSYSVDEDPFKGINPPMGIVEDKDIQDYNNFTPTVYQGVVRKGINRLVALSHEETEDGTDKYDNKQLKEIIPLYKRDYTLADGSAFTIHLLLPEMSNNYDYPSYDQFINLFFACGYQYTYTNLIRDHYVNTKKTVNGEEVYGWKDNVRTVSKKCTDKDVLFGIDLVTMLAVKAIYEELKNGVSNNGKSACLDANGQFSRANTLAWLKTKSLPRDFIFNSPVPTADGGMVYKYTEAGIENPKTYDIEIGLEVNSFGSTIRYYDHDASKYVNCPVWKTAEVQGALDLFQLININRERELKAYYTFTFQVINLVQTIENYQTGTFIGFTPFVWSNDNMFSNQLKSVSSFSTSTHPHRHAIFMGPPTYKEQPDYTGTSGTITADSMARAEGYQQMIPNGEKQPYPNRGDRNLYSYTFSEMKDVKYVDEIRDGVCAKVIQWNSKTSATNADPRWRDAEPNRGVTGPPIDQGIINEKYVAASANSVNGEVKWFQPESIQMVPLIKL